MLPSYFSEDSVFGMKPRATKLVVKLTQRSVSVKLTQRRTLLTNSGREYGCGRKDKSDERHTSLMSMALGMGEAQELNPRLLVS